jgi:RNA polymerase sigma factor (sigma-70 family)
MGGAEQSGLTAMFAHHRADLLRFLRARCNGDEQEAEDCLQDLWLKLEGTSTGPIANPKAYLFRIANNLLIDRKRSQVRAMRRDRDWLGVADSEPELRVDHAQLADEALAEQQEVEILRRAIDQLPPGARRALQLYRFEERGQAEIAAIMGISLSGVEKHLALAMKHLRNLLTDCGAFGTVTSLQAEGAEAANAPKEQGQ